MERYSETKAMEGAATADPVAEWTAPSGDTELEEPMWQLGLGSGPESYPERPDEADCIYYLRTGFCGFGARCRFNHPPDRAAAMGALRATGGEYPERVGQPLCQYYMKTGMCKFGASCKYHHPRQGGGSSTPVNLNIYGYPLRPGEKECSYYEKTGQCKFGATCKFHHPQPAGVQMPAPAPGPGPFPAPAAVGAPAIYPTLQSPSVQSSQQYGVVAGNWPIPRPTLLPGSYVPGTYGPVLLSPGMIPVPGWTSYPAPINPAATASAQPSTVGAGPIYGITQLSPSDPAYTGQYLSIASSTAPSGSNQKEHAFPERPGQPECMYYMKTGDCKFGASCRYHHPHEWSAQKGNLVLSPMGLPLRPGASVCSHYLQNGVCKFGPSCKFDHPMGTLSYSPSASSLADMPVAPYPVGSSIGTLAPSSSSSDLRPELISGSSKDVFSIRMSSVSGSSSSVGSLFSKSGIVLHSSAQQPGQGISTSSGSNSTAHGNEVRTSS